MASIALAGCGQKTSAPSATGTPIGAAASDAEAQAVVDAKAAELEAKEREIADREAALKQRELEDELARRDAELAAAKAEADAAKAAAAAAAAKPAAKAASKPAAKPATAAAAESKTAPAAPIVVPAGTALAVELAHNVNTKKAVVGAPVEGRLASALVVDGRTAAKAGATVKGAVTQVVSGSQKIGGVPTLGLRFDTLVAADGSTKTINASYTTQGKSETGKDTAKIVGGAAAGAVIGHQVGNDDKGTVIGGLLGAGAGAAAAHKTGADIKLTAGQVLEVSTTSGFEVKP
jgi:hypothetical protein